MGLTLQTVPSARGLQWLRQGFVETWRHPLAYAGLFAVFMLAMAVLVLVPVIGGVLMLGAVPLLSLGFMMATAGSQRGVPVHAGVYLAPWRGTPVLQRRRLLALCGAYALSSLCVLLLCNQIDGGRFDELLSLAAEGKADTPEWAALAGDPAVQTGALLRGLLTVLLSVPFWHAPALVQWGGQGVAQSLFSSVLAVWRTRGAFTLYALGWLALTAATGGALALLLSLLGLGQAMSVVVMPLGLLFTAAFYVSLYFSFVESFSQGRSEAV